MNKILLTCTAAFAALASCTSEMPVDLIEQPGEINLNEIVLTVPDTLGTVSRQRAAEIATKFFGKRYPDSRAESKGIAEIKAVCDSDGKELMYIVNFAGNQGFVIVSAEKGYYPILAQSDEGNFTTDNTDSPAYMWLMSQKYNVANCAELPDSMKSEIAQAWTAYDYQTGLDVYSRAYVEKPQVYYDSLRMWSVSGKYKVYNYNDFIHTDDYQTLSFDDRNQISANLMMLGNSNYGTVEDVTVVLVRDYTDYADYPKTMLKSAWTQLYPYNVSDWLGHALGCTTIAVGQIMRYHEWPKSYNWADMPYSTVTKTLQDFLYNLSQIIGVKYEGMKATAKIDQSKVALEKNNYSVVMQSHNINKVDAQIKAYKPVYMSGSGDEERHAWVCDGIDSYTNYHEIRVMTLDYRPIADIVPTEMIEAMKILKPTYISGHRYHMNWGLIGTDNGFFLENGSNNPYSKNRMELLITPNK
ncbi:MAG: C10 family peptidase [Paramuribaculum sp.]|nr:C10 family peptidase [Paramuribaculum sp.]